MDYKENKKIFNPRERYYKATYIERSQKKKKPSHIITQNAFNNTNKKLKCFTNA